MKHCCDGLDCPPPTDACYARSPVQCVAGGCVYRAIACGAGVGCTDGVCGDGVTLRIRAARSPHGYHRTFDQSVDFTFVFENKTNVPINIVPPNKTTVAPATFTCDGVTPATEATGWLDGSMEIDELERHTASIPAKQSRTFKLSSITRLLRPLMITGRFIAPASGSCKISFLYHYAGQRPGRYTGTILTEEVVFNVPPL
jgi:hypothetical protein